MNRLSVGQKIVHLWLYPNSKVPTESLWVSIKTRTIVSTPLHCAQYKLQSTIRLKYAISSCSARLCYFESAVRPRDLIKILKIIGISLLSISYLLCFVLCVLTLNVAKAVSSFRKHKHSHKLIYSWCQVAAKRERNKSRKSTLARLFMNERKLFEWHAENVKKTILYYKVLV